MSFASHSGCSREGQEDGQTFLVQDKGARTRELAMFPNSRHPHNARPERDAKKMRSIIRQRRRLMVQETIGQWNDDPSNKFVNEHAWVLPKLVSEKLIALTDKRRQEYAPGALRSG